jgi:hypothetical protein
LKHLPDYEEGKITIQGLTRSAGIGPGAMPFIVSEGKIKESSPILHGASQDEIEFIRQVAERMH